MAKTSEEEYQYWIDKFYTGTMFVSGWNQQIETALAGLEGTEREETEKQLRALGDKICLEWAKDNATRKIDSQDLLQFGNRIKTAKKNGINSLMATLSELDKLVDERLTK